MTSDIYSKGSIITDEQFAPFNRYIDVNGLRMFVLDKVKDEFVLDVANTFEAMFPQSSDTIDLASQQLILQSMSDYKHFQRIGYIGPPEDGEPASAPLSGDWEFAQDYIWEKPNSSTASQIGEVVEHLLHTISSLSLKYTFPEKWDWDDTSSDVYLAMQEAIDKGIYNVSSYSSLKSDPEGYNKIIVQEFVYWFVSAEWDYFEVMGLSVNGSWEGGSNEEWSLLTSQEVEEQLPLAHKLYVESFSKLVQKPSASKVTEWFSTDSSVADSIEGDISSNTESKSNTLNKQTYDNSNQTIETIYKEPEIISQNSSQSVLKLHEHQYGQTLLDLTFLNIDEGTIEFTTIVQDGTTYSYGNEEQYKRFSADKDSIKLQENSAFVGRDLSYIYDPEDKDPFETSSYITSVTFKYKSNGVEKEHAVIIEEIIDDIDRSGSFAKNKYTIDIYGKEISKLNEETKTLILDNTEYVIRDLATKMSWKGTMDFGINVNTDSNKPKGTVSAIAFNMATNSSGERVHSATHEQETGEDLNGITIDLGMNISLQDSYDPEIGQLTVYNSNLWFDPNPNPNSFSNKPENDGSTDQYTDYMDFISIVYHEIFHAMGIAYGGSDTSNAFSKNILPADSEGNIYYSSDRVKAILEDGILLDDYNNTDTGGDHFNLGPPKDYEHTIEFKDILQVGLGNTEPIILSQSLSNSSINVYEGSSSSKNLLDLTFLDADKGSFNFKYVTLKGDETIYSYGSEEVYQRFQFINNTIKLYEASYFDREDGLIYTYDPEDEDPRLGAANIDTVSFTYMVDGAKGELATIMNSVGYYDYSWREPTDLDWAVIQDIGWTKKTEGILSETINLSENILISHTENTISGTLNFNTGNNIIILEGQASTYRGLGGDDVYFISNLLPKSSKISIVDTEGFNIVQIPTNTYIDKTLFTKNAARLTLEDGREITISGANNFTYNIGGNITNANKGTDLTFTEFAEIFGVNNILDASSSQNGLISDLYII
ncbi:MAG: hypothetical protein ACJZ9D_01740 [Alphaproteobacteria bacterium]